MLSQGWKDTMDAAVRDPRVNAYDATLQAEIRDYDARLGRTPGYVSPPFRLFKALLLVESGGPAAPAWTGRVAQIGNPGDPAYGVLTRGEEGAALVMSDGLRERLRTVSADDPVLNIRAGLAYVMTRAVQQDFRSVTDAADPDVHRHTVVSGDNFSRIARTERTTVPDLQVSNPNTGRNLRVGQGVNFHHASMQWVITGWRTIDAAFLASRYNQGDPAYAEKLAYVLGVLR